MSRQFSAGPGSLGYLYQILRALYLILESSEETKLSIESLDDVVFEEAGKPRQLLQLKHHVNKEASLTDSSEDLWRTLRIWSTHVKEKTILLPETILVLVTTVKAADNSIASLLRSTTDRNTKLAYERLLDIAERSENQALQKAFRAFLSLIKQEQIKLVECIQILDSSPDISETETEIRKRIEFAVRREHLDGLYERLEGWWISKAIKHLRENSKEPITRYEVHDKINSIAEQFRPDALPIDYLEVQPPTPPDPEGDNRVFVLQLKEIAVHYRRIEKAIIDYYRAFEQRSRWVREDLLIGDELEIYEKKLVDEWERFFDARQDDRPFDGLGDEELKQWGREIYKWTDQIADIRIRPQVTEDYIMRGSYQMLADENPPRVWWHPKFRERLKELLRIPNIE